LVGKLSKKYGYVKPIQYSSGTRTRLKWHFEDNNAEEIECCLLDDMVILVYTYLPLKAKGEEANREAEKKAISTKDL
jgi:hypothetical protein